MIIYTNKTEVANAKWLKSRQAVDTLIKKWEVKLIRINKWKKEIKFYIIVKETIIELLR